MKGPWKLFEALTDPRGVSERDRARALDRARILAARTGGFFPFFRTVEGATSRQVKVDGEWKLVLGSNNYLGLTHHPRVLEAARDALAAYGTGATGSRLLNGTFDLHEELEERLAGFLGKEDAVVCSAGYLTNLATLSGVLGRHDHVLLDRLNHASLLDAALLSRASTRRYPHDDVRGLRRSLARLAGQDGRKLVVTDGVFSMDGSVADLRVVVDAAGEAGADVMVDDAHGLGVMGPEGRGTPHDQGVQDRVALVMATFSKSLASIGGVVAGSRDDCWEIRHRARPFIFTAAAPPSALAVVGAALDVMEDEPERRERLWSSSHRLRDGLADAGYDVGSARTHVIPVFAQGVTRIGRLWKRLFRDGIFTQAVIPPAVPPDGIRLRLSVTPDHTDEDLERVVEAFRRHGKALGIV
ncbi:MAG: aminotransferase class I/II-fold pyridoxal phosphate-dependent enzyme [Gemmatimonadota bacterium]|jgi:8-amino-7-oxononanoate synthase